MPEPNDEELEDAFNSMTDTFRLIMGAKKGRLEPPVDLEVELTGDQAEAIGSARQICDEICEQGYNASEEYIRELEPLFDDRNDGRHLIKIVVETSPEGD